LVRSGSAAFAAGTASTSGKRKVMKTMLRRLFWLPAVIAAWLGITIGMAAQAAGRPFDPVAFEALQKAGRPILLVVHADWCATCRTQEPVLAELLSAPKHAGFVTFRIDFDRQKDLLKRFRVQWQSTLIVYRGAREVSRSTAVVERDAIAAQLAKAL
jgi:thiol:disulfide interchange protein